MSCCTECGDGCVGGYPYRAFDFLKDVGAVSGGNYASPLGCKPYPFPPCHINYDPQCSTDMQAPSCSKSCQASFPHNYTSDRYYALSQTYYTRDVEAIQREIMTRGPVVTAALKTYSDFLYYKKGVYEYVKGRFVGLHAVRIIGWGTDTSSAKPVDYWLVANSWSRSWGEDGYFRIRRGVNEANIEGTINAAVPDNKRSKAAFAYL